VWLTSHVPWSLHGLSTPPGHARRTQDRKIDHFSQVPAIVLLTLTIPAEGIIRATGYKKGTVSNITSISICLSHLLSVCDKAIVQHLPLLCDVCAQKGELLAAQGVLTHETTILQWHLHCLILVNDTWRQQYITYNIGGYLHHNLTDHKHSPLFQQISPHYINNTRDYNP